MWCISYFKYLFYFIRVDLIVSWKKHFVAPIKEKQHISVRKKIWFALFLLFCLDFEKLNIGQLQNQIIASPEKFAKYLKNLEK